MSLVDALQDGGEGSPNFILQLNSSIPSLPITEWDDEGAYTGAQNCSFPGDDAATTSSEVGTPAECADACYGEAGCTHFTWLGDVCTLRSAPLSSCRG